MLHSDYTSVLLQTSQQVFEDTAFAFVDPPEDENLPDLDPEDYEAYEIRFSGPFSGSISMALQKTLPEILAASMLGAEADDPEVTEKSNDAMGELLNIICGNILPIMAGPQAEFSLDSPSVVTLDLYKKDREASKNSGFAQMIVEGSRVEIYMCISVDSSLISKGK